MGTIPVNLTEERSSNVNRDCPAWVKREIQKIGGMVGDKPRFRVVWGGSRWMTGADGMTLIRPYRLDMWHLEKWHDPSGDYEHCYRLGECPHRKSKAEPFCRNCFLDGGAPLEPDTSYAFIESLIRMLQLGERMQKEALNKNDRAQKGALFGREEKKAQEGQQKTNEAYADAMPKTVKRSFETPMRITADQALGRPGKVKQLNTREILRGLRRKRAN